jgi:DNA-binding PucR family transcriptional regulator
MLKKLQALYPNSILSKQKPEDYFSRYHWFSDDSHEWVGIPKEELLDNQLAILSSLFDYYQTGNQSYHSSAPAQSWYTFLFEDGSFPAIENEKQYRLIYFQWSSGKISFSDFEAALEAFFGSTIIIIWENAVKGIIIEPKTKQPLLENDYIAMKETLKTDFFIEPYFYIGKFRYLTEEFLPLIRIERALFEYACKHFRKEKVFHFEMLAPRHLAMHLPEELKKMIQQDIIPIFNEDRELFLTIKSFLKNNMHASNTAKNLFIHRNTLQYRLDKFAEKTGIPLKDFYSAMTVYLACIVFDIEV